MGVPLSEQERVRALNADVMECRDADEADRESRRVDAESGRILRERGLGPSFARNMERGALFAARADELRGRREQDPGKAELRREAAMISFDMAEMWQRMAAGEELTAEETTTVDKIALDYLRQDAS